MGVPRLPHSRPVTHGPPSWRRFLETQPRAAKYLSLQHHTASSLPGRRGAIWQGEPAHD
ncbi:hypothetical protein HMPREF9946_01474 [Acetobacteraceae bacterium AT-5844]|nr:hypothetical protein HMPREF9946_01474 [Acetobacteraceae bacterium AT-5844]